MTDKMMLLHLVIFLVLVSVLADILKGIIVPHFKKVEYYNKLLSYEVPSEEKELKSKLKDLKRTFILKLVLIFIIVFGLETAVLTFI